MPVGVAVIDRAGAVILSNAAYRRLAPRGPLPSFDSAVRARWRAFDTDGRPIEPHDFPEASALRGESVLPGQEMLYRDDTGAEIRTSVASVPMFDQAGAVTGIVSMVSDIDYGKRRGEALRQIAPVIR